MCWLSDRHLCCSWLGSFIFLGIYISGGSVCLWLRWLGLLVPTPHVSHSAKGFPEHSHSQGRGASYGKIIQDLSRLGTGTLSILSPFIDQSKLKCHFWRWWNGFHLWVRRTMVLVLSLIKRRFKKQLLIRLAYHSVSSR